MKLFSLIINIFLSTLLYSQQVFAMTGYGGAPVGGGYGGGGMMGGGYGGGGMMGGGYGGMTPTGHLGAGGMGGYGYSPMGGGGFGGSMGMMGMSPLYGGANAGMSPSYANAAMMGSAVNNAGNAVMDVRRTMSNTQLLMDTAIDNSNEKTSYRDDVYPQCEKPPAIPKAVASNVCSPGSISHESQLGINDLLQQRLGKMAAVYDEALTKGKSKDNNLGIECLNEAKKDIDKEMEQKKRKLQDAIKQIIAMKEKLERDLTERSLAIGQSTKNLEGASTREELEKAFPEIFNNPACMSNGINLGPILTQNAGQINLLNLKNGIASSGGDDAKTFTSRQANIGNEINSTLARLLNDKDDPAPQDGEVPPEEEDGGTIAFLKKIVNDNKKETQKKYTTALRNLERAGSATGNNTLTRSLPSQEEIFGLGYDSVKNTIPTEKQLIQDAERSCSESNPFLRSRNLQSIVNAVVENQGGKILTEVDSPNVQNFKAQLRDIMVNAQQTAGVPYDEIVKRVEQLEKRYGNTIQANIGSLSNDGSTGGGMNSASRLLKENIGYCRNWLGSSDSSEAGGQTRKDLLLKSRRELSEVMEEVGGWDKKIKSRIDARINKCESTGFGNTSKLSYQCDATAFDYRTNSNFCMPHAKKCASAFQECGDIAEKSAKKEEVKRKKMVDEFNAVATKGTESLEARLKEIKGDAQKMFSDLAKKYKIEIDFPLNFDDLDVPPKTPAGGNDKVALVGGGSIQFLVQVGERGNMIDQAFAQLKQKVDQEHQQYVQTVEQNLTKQKETLAQDMQQCSQAVNQFKQQDAQKKMMQDQYRRQKLAQLMNFCGLLNQALIQNGCHQGQVQQLMSTFAQISSFEIYPGMPFGIGPEAGLLNSYVESCRETGMMNLAGTGAASGAAAANDDNSPDIMAVCLSPGGTGETALYNAGKPIELKTFMYTRLLKELGVTVTKEQIMEEVKTAIKSQAELDNNTFTMFGKPASELSKNVGGQYILQLAKLNYAVRDYRTDPAPSTPPAGAPTPPASGKGPQALCNDVRYAAKKLEAADPKIFDACSTKGQMNSNPDPSYISKCKAAVLKDDFGRQPDAIGPNMARIFGAVSVMASLDDSTLEAQYYQTANKQMHGMKSMPGCAAASNTSTMPMSPGGMGGMMPGMQGMRTGM